MYVQSFKKVGPIVFKLHFMLPLTILEDNASFTNYCSRDIFFKKKYNLKCT